MFIGHYGIGLALKKADKKTPLWAFFLAVMVIDILFYIFLIAGLEKVKVVPGYTEWVPLKTIYYPYSHGLAATALWSVLVSGVVLAAGRFGLLKREDYPKAAALLGIAVFSHFFCDIIVHIPDLPLLGNDGPKLGMGLWNYPVISNSIEIAMFLGGLFIYTRVMGIKEKKEYLVPAVFAAGLIAFHLSLGLVPPIKNTTILGINLLAVSLIVAGIGALIERKIMKKQ